MSLSISDVINVQLLDQPMGATRRNLGMAVIFSHENGECFHDPATLYAFVSSANDVARLFGIDSDTYRAAQQLFSIRPTPRRAIVARWVREARQIPASRNMLRGSTVSVDVNILREITNGSFSLIVGGKRKEYSGLDFTEAVDMSDIADLITDAVDVDGIEVVFDKVGIRFIVQSKDDGDLPATRLGYSVRTHEGIYIGALLRLEDGQGTISNGKAAISILKESPAGALNALHNVYSNWYGIYFAASLTDGELDSAHSWVVSSANERVLAYTAIKEAQLEWKEDNIIKKLFDKNSGRLMVQYNNTGDDHAGAALLAKAISTNWAGQNTAQTLKFKQQPNVRSDARITITEAEKCRRLGINFYTDFDGVPMVAEGVMVGKRWIDEIVGLDAFIDACRVQAFNTLQGNPTAIRQTDKGQESLIGSLQVIGYEFVRNGFLAEGMTWNGNDIGELLNGSRLEDGYYFYSDPYDIQNSSDRQERKAMPIMAAVKLSGAIHSLDIIIQFNR